MCKIYNKIGCLTYIKNHLEIHNIRDLNSLGEVIEFQNSYMNYRLQIKEQHEHLVENERNELKKDLDHLHELIERQKLDRANEFERSIEEVRRKIYKLTCFLAETRLQQLTKSIMLWYYNKLIQYKKSSFNSKQNNSFKALIDLQQQKTARYQFIISNFNEAVALSCKEPLAILDRKQRVVSELSSYIAGAIGEQYVVKELEKLSDEYYLINDFSISFTQPLYNIQARDTIRSVQIDHILIAPSGVFLIETKNWSAESLKSIDLRSPVEQIKRTSFVLFKLLNNDTTRLLIEKHNWGEKKISIKNLIVLINSKPQEEFQYVKILTLNQLLGYVRYFKPLFSSIEVQRIAEYLIHVNNQKILDTVGK